jgi:uncharacterized RDD family membrane protein YckC
MATVSGPRPASLLRRLGAMLYDALLILAIWMLTTLVLVILTDAFGMVVARPLLQSILFIQLFAFFAYFWTRRGQTLGMLAWRIHIEDAEGGPITLKQALKRFIGALAALGSLGLGYLWMYLDPARRTWPDAFSDTCLIYTPPGWQAFDANRANA